MWLWQREPVLVRTSGSDISQDILPKWEAGWEEERGRTTVSEVLLAPVAFLNWVCTKSTKESEILVLTPLCQKMLHKPQWGGLCHYKNKIIFTFFNLTEVNTEPINWAQPVLEHHFLLFNPSAFTFSCRTVFHCTWSPKGSLLLHSCSTYLGVHGIMGSFTRSTWQQ